jgi:hypothetical protein
MPALLLAKRLCWTINGSDNAVLCNGPDVDWKIWGIPLLVIIGVFLLFVLFVVWMFSYFGRREVGGSGWVGLVSVG